MRIFHVARVNTGYPIISVVDPDSTYQPDAVPYSDFLFDTDPDSTFLPDADPDSDPDPDPSFKKRLKPLKKC